MKLVDNTLHYIFIGRKISNNSNFVVDICYLPKVITPSYGFVIYL